ncbi:MAG: RNA polymerase factor sigma-32 [Alphaproteobacteria bacterium]|nr:RNA polymerase factor sigma-32 [Alphaproteobacteria bacterium]
MAHIDDTDTQRANVAFIRNSMRAPLLERDHEFELARRWRERGDQTALHELVTAYTRLVVATATRFRHYGLPVGDLIQEGNLGLMQAAARFEPAREVRFSTYAAWWIRSQMQDFILRNWSIVRTGTTAAQKSLFFNLRRLRSRIDEAANGPLSRASQEKIAKTLQVRVADVAEMESRLSGPDQSLNATLAEDGDDEWQDLLPDSRPTPEEVAMVGHDTHVRLKWLSDALGELSSREQVVIRQRRLEGDGDGVTLEELGKELGVSKERVRQIEQRALSKLRDALIRRAGTQSALLPHN